MFREILIALKFSPAGWYAFDRAVRLARSHNAQLHVFHALDYHLKDLDHDDPKLVEALRSVDHQIEKEPLPAIGRYGEGFHHLFTS